MEFKVVRSHPVYFNHSIVLKTLKYQSYEYFVVGAPVTKIGELYVSIIAQNERKYENNEYLDISDISKIVSNFIKNNTGYEFECNIGLSLSNKIQTDNVSYFDRTYRYSDYIYQFPGEIYMCMAHNECEPNKIYIIVGGIDKNDN